LSRRHPALRLTDAVGVFALIAVAFTAAAALALGLPAAPAWAHSGDGLAQPVVDQVSPLPPGITVQVAYSVNYELLVGDRTAQAITFLADSGEPFLRIGPAGVEGNFASPTFYASNAPEGLSRFPDQAKPGPDVPPDWRKISAQPEWGWYDHRLHPTVSYVPPAIIRAAKPAVLGPWRIPFRVGDGAGQPGEVKGRFEFRPPTGSYTMVQQSSPSPADGVKIQVVPSATVPAVFVENLGPETVLVLGRDGEPFARIGPKITEVNLKSPTWAEIEQARGHDPPAEADSAAAPQWQAVSDTPRWSWPEFRAAAPGADPPAAVVKAGRAVTVKTWSIPYLIADRRAAVAGVTRWVPIAALRRQAAGASGGSGGGGRPLPAYAALAAAAAGLAAGGWLLTSKVRSRSRTAAKGEPWTS
jgi:hypothetical protein